MQQIHGNKQIKLATLSFDRTDSNFAIDTFGQKSIVDFVQINNIASIPTSGTLVLDLSSDLGNAITNVGNVAGAPSPSDLGFIATVENDPYLSRSRCIIRDGDQDVPSR